jgi:cation:H+ antiporter
MPAQVLLLLLGLVLILLAAEFFTNGIEALGRHFSFSQAVVGSILAAVGTALPETILPVVAIFFYGGKSAADIGVGAILGAPFMLSTLALFLVGLTALVSALRKKRKLALNIEPASMKRDLTFFLVMYSLAVLLPHLLGKKVLVPLSISLVCGYLFYAYLTFRDESAGLEHTEMMYLWRLIKRVKPSVRPETPPLALILLQVAASLALMIQGARTFVESLEHVAVRLGMNPLLFALLLAPVATELPEKFNSVTWTWKGKDSLALGNITGAMVFQSVFPVSVGLLFTEWQITGMALFSALIAITSSLVILATLLAGKKISPFTMLFPGCLYLVYVLVVILR